MLRVGAETYRGVMAWAWRCLRRLRRRARFGPDGWPAWPTYIFHWRLSGTLPA